MEQKLGYTATDADLKFNGTEITPGQTYFVNNDGKLEALPEGQITIGPLDYNTEVKMNQAKFCDTLQDAFERIKPNNGKNRFFKIESFGQIEENTYSASQTRCLKFVEEISPEELLKHEATRKEEFLEKRMNLDLVKKIQTEHPHLIIGGSTSLFLQGGRLKRFDNGTSDLDLVSPYFTLLKSSGDLSIGEIHEERDEDYSDYGTIMTINGIKADLRVDPKQRYEYVEYKGFQYKVTPLLSILEAKVRYAGQKWGEKHRSDLYELILQK